MVENTVLWVDGEGEHRFNATGQVGCPFFGRLIRDCLDRTETAMTQAHAFAAAELCLQAQAMAARAAAQAAPGRPWPPALADGAPAAGPRPHAPTPKGETAGPRAPRAR